MKRLLLAAVLVAVACGHNDSSPTDPIAAIERGTLNGLVTIGPCPGPIVLPDCTTPPSAYASRKVQVYDAARTKLLYTVDIDNGGFYSIDLAPNTYTVDLKPNGTDKSNSVPAQVTIKKNQTTKLNIAIDTGIR